MIDFPQLFASLPGRYVTQAFIHSLVAAAVAEIAMKNWRVESSFIRQKFLLAVIVLPVFSFPAYQLANPARGSVYFRMGAIFDSGRWLSLEVYGVIPFVAGLVVMFSLTALVFFFQELFPIVRHAFAARRADFGGAAVRAGDDPQILEAVGPLPGEKPRILVLEDEDCIIFSTTGRKAAVYVSTGLLEYLTVEELRAALAHEFAHVARSRRPVLVTVFLLRSLMFFNPVALLEFRRSVQEDEMICDEMAATATGKPLVMAETLRKLYLEPETGEDGGSAPGPNAMGRMEDYSHRLNIEGRISRLEAAEERSSGASWFGFALTVLAVAAVNYYVV